MSTSIETKIENIELELIKPSSTNPRKHFDETKLQELAESIKEYGLLQPIMLRAFGTEYEIIYGERRFRASKLAGLTSIKAEVVQMDDESVFEIQVLENLQREDINPLDEARAFQSLMKKETLDWLASKINKSKKYVLDRVKLLDLCSTAQFHLESGVLPLGHAVLLSKIDVDSQEKLIKSTALFTNSSRNNEITICTKTLNQLKDYIAGTMLSFDRVNFNLDDAELIPAVGSCQSCPKRTINQNLLFGDITENDLCTDSFCFNAKLKRQVEVNIGNAKEEFGDIQQAHTDPWSSQIILAESKEKVSYSKEKSEKYTVPVIITKTDNYSQKDLGRTIWIEDKEKEIVEEISNTNHSNSTPEWKLRTIKEFNEITIPRFETIFKELIEKPFSTHKVTNLFLIDRLCNCTLRNLLVVAHILEVRQLENLSYQGVEEITKDLDRSQDFQMCFEVAKQLCDGLSTELIILIVALDDIITNDLEDNDYPEWDFYLMKVYETLGLSENESNEEDIKDLVVEAKEFIKNHPTQEEEIGEGSSAITSTLDFPTFEKITRKRFSLNNSYFKNRTPQMPATPLDVMYYFNQHGELPFDMGSDTDNWLYETYIEYQKRNNVYHSQFFTPPATAIQMCGLAHQYFDKEMIVLDACCGFGALSKPLIQDGFRVMGFDFSNEMVQLYNSQFLTQTVDVCEQINFMEGEFDKKYYNIISNPPYEGPALTKFLECIHENLIDGGTAVLLIPKNFVDKDKPKALVSILEKFTVTHREDMQEDFARTGIKAEIVVLEKA